MSSYWSPSIPWHVLWPWPDSILSHALSFSLELRVWSSTWLVRNKDVIYINKGIALFTYIYIYRFQNVFLHCPTPRLHCFLSSQWPSFTFLSFAHKIQCHIQTKDLDGYGVIWDMYMWNCNAAHTGSDHWSQLAHLLVYTTPLFSTTCSSIS